MTYQMGGTILSMNVKEKDIGVTMNANMKVSEQCRIAASKGNQPEKIQGRATKLIPGLRDLRYEERLKECGLLINMYN